MMWTRSVGVFLVVLVLFAAGCNDVSEIVEPPEEAWTHEGLEDVEVRELAAEDDVLYAATEDGLYGRPAAEEGTWERLGFEGRAVNDILPLDSELLIAVEISGEEADTVSLHRSTDEGESWEASQEGFGMGGASNEVLALEHVPGTSTLFASGQNIVVARSEDNGYTWEAVWGEWDHIGLGTHALAVHPEEHDIVWAGGEQAAFVPFLTHSEDGGETWNEQHPDLGGDNATNAIALDPNDPEFILAGMEGTLLRSNDGGESWESVLEPEGYPYFYGLAFSEVEPGRAYAAGAENHANPQPLVLYVSDDHGATWNEVEIEAAEYGGAFDVLSVEEAGGEAVYVATQQGIYRYAP